MCHFQVNIKNRSTERDLNCGEILNLCGLLVLDLDLGAEGVKFDPKNHEDCSLVI